MIDPTQEIIDRVIDSCIRKIRDANKQIESIQKESQHYLKMYQDTDYSLRVVKDQLGEAMELLMECVGGSTLPDDLRPRVEEFLRKRK